MKTNRIDGPGSEKRNIDTVLYQHTAELMAIKGVVGLFVGETDEKIPCIRVMVEEKTAALEKRIPSHIEGHPVVIEETGKIKPL